MKQPVKTTPVRKSPPPPDLLLRLTALVKKPAADRASPRWKQECEVLMGVDDLHVAAEFWILRSQYAELLRSKTESAVKAITTPVVLGLEGGAEPREVLQSRALRLVKRLYGDWSKVKHAKEMAAALQNAVRKRFRPSAQPAAPRATGASTGLHRDRELEHLYANANWAEVDSEPGPAFTCMPKGERHEVVAMADGSPQTKNRELDHLYGDADWTEPAADFWANSSSVVFDVPSAAEVEAAERALEAAAQSGSAAELAQALQEAEEKGVAEQAVEAAKGALVEIMRQTIPASPRSAEYSSPQSVPSEAAETAA